MRTVDQYKIKLYHELAKQNTLTPDEISLMAVLLNDPALEALFETATAGLPEPTMSEVEIKAKVMADSIFDCDTSQPMDVTDEMIIEMSEPYSVIDELEKFLHGVQKRKAQIKADWQADHGIVI